MRARIKPAFGRDFLRSGKLVGKEFVESFNDKLSDDDKLGD